MIRQILADFVDARLLAAGTGIEYEDFHIWAGAKLLRFLAIRGATDLPNAKIFRNTEWPGIHALPASIGRSVTVESMASDKIANSLCDHP